MKVTRPESFCLPSSSRTFAATLSLSTTTLNNLFPAVTSTAVENALSQVNSSIKGPCTPLMWCFSTSRKQFSRPFRKSLFRREFSWWFLLLISSLQVRICFSRFDLLRHSTLRSFCAVSRSNLSSFSDSFALSFEALYFCSRQSSVSSQSNRLRKAVHADSQQGARTSIVPFNRSISASAAFNDLFSVPISFACFSFCVFISAS